MKAHFKEELAEQLSCQIKWDYPLREYTSFRIGGPATAVITVVNENELHHVLKFVLRHNVLFRVIGRGTNLLVRDEGYPGFIIVLSGDFKQYAVEEIGGNVYVDAGAGCSFTRLSTLCMEKGLSGLEFIVGIPGTVGGAAVMNAGAWGADVSGIVESITMMTAEGQRKYSRDELRFSYRKLHFPTTLPTVVSAVRFKVGSGDKEQIRKTCENYREQRLTKQPIGTANAGSVFKNPVGASAGQLIEASGLKGITIGDAVISEKHANFIVNRGKATADDVLELIANIREKVRKDSGIDLELEVHIL